MKPTFNTRPAEHIFKLGQLHALLFVPKSVRFADTSDARDLEKSLLDSFKADEEGRRVYPFPYIDDLTLEGDGAVIETLSYTGKKVKVKDGVYSLKVKHLKGFELNKRMRDLENYVNGYSVMLVNKAGDLLGAQSAGGGVRGLTIESFFTDKIDLYTGQAVEKFGFSLEFSSVELESNFKVVRGLFSDISQIEGLGELTLGGSAKIQLSTNEATFTGAIYWGDSNATELVLTGFANKENQKKLLTFTNRRTGETVTASDVAFNKEEKTLRYTLDKVKVKEGDRVLITFPAVSTLESYNIAGFAGVDTEVEVVSVGTSAAEAESTQVVASVS